jgi:CheY-like chemotaxis protein/HPt (histidine-containing phosphotransfer) domain-containing protein
VSGDGGALDDLRREFGDDVHRRLVGLGRAVDRSDVQRARRLAHALVGSAAALSLDGLRVEVERVEALLAADPLDVGAVGRAVEAAQNAADGELPRPSAELDPAEELEQLSHDLRTPLSAVAGFAQLLTRGELTAEQRRYVDGIVDAGARLAALLDDALRVVRVQIAPSAGGAAGEAGGDSGTPGGVAEPPALTIVYVEDDPVSVAVLEGMLAERTDVRLLVAATGAEGLALAVEERPDLVLLDLGLPDIEGAEVFRQLRAASPRAPVAVVSGDTRPERIAELKGAGVDDYFPKPVDSCRLLRFVDTLVPT